MISDDLTALSAMSMGALVPAALTLALLTQDAEPSVVEAAAPMRAVQTCARPPSNIVDFAIIRSDDGSTSIRTGTRRGGEQDTESLEIRLLRSR